MEAAAGALDEQQLGEPVLGTLNYAVRADPEAIEAFKARTAQLTESAMARGGKGTEGAGRFFAEPREVAVYDLRPALDSLSIDRHGVIVARKPEGWEFSDELEAVLDPRERELRSVYYPELEALALESVVTADGRRAKHAICAATQKFTEDKSRGYLGAYSRQIHTDIFEIRPDVDDTETGFWDPSNWDAAHLRSGPRVLGGGARQAASEALAEPLVHPYAGMVFGGGHSSASQYQRKGEAVPPGVSTMDGPENLLRSRGISADEARGMDIMMVNAWRPFSWPVADNPLAILDWSSVSLSDLYRIPSGLPMTPGEPPQRITFNPDHRWVYVPEMAPEEVLFFKQGDTRVGTARDDGLSRFGFHTAFRLPGDPGGPEGHRTRRSLASRLLLLFDKPDEAKL